MPAFLRRRLSCFYCGGTSSQAYTAGLRKWVCDSCEAPNYLDTNGNFADPPAVSTPTANPRYGRPAPRPTSPQPVGDSALFCETCLKNQALLTQTLSNYLPSPDDPKYDQYEASYPEFKRRLEQRLPQVCAECEPRVQRRIQEAGYAAKADHLRRVMERAKQSRASAESWVWRWRVATLGWLLQSAALGGHLLFHALGILALEEPGLRDDTTPPSLQACLELGFHQRQVSPNCAGSARPFLGWGTVFALLSIWWNPIMGRKALVRVRGLGEFYKLQLILLLARLVSWYVFREDSDHDFEIRTAKAIHGVSLAFNIAVSMISRWTVHADSGPEISFSRKVVPLSSPEAQSQDQEPSRGRRGDTSLKTSFPVSALASPSPRRSQVPSYQPPTPPSEDDGDAMDLDTPDKTTQFNSPSIRRRQAPPMPSEPAPSPFKGNVPAAPSRKWHNVPRDPQKTNPQADKPLLPPGSSFAFPGPQSSRRERAHGAPSTPTMAAPKLFVADTPVTGLEKLVSGFLSLDNEPPEIRQPASLSVSLSASPSQPGGASSPPQALPSAPGPASRLLHALSTVILLAAIATWHLRPSPAARTAVLGAAAAVPASRIVARAVATRVDLALVVLELFFAGALLVELRSGKHQGAGPVAFLGCLAAQELLAWATGWGVPRGQAGAGRPTGEVEERDDRQAVDAWRRQMGLGSQGS